MHEPNPIRRRLLKNALILAGSCTLLSWQDLLWASLPSNQRLLVVVLRGGMDGLGAIPPIGDKDYYQARGEIAFNDQGLLPLNGFFAFNAALTPFQKMYTQGELLVLHACATPYRERSHFDAQDLLENGSLKPHGLQTGWLGRTVDSLGGTVQSLAIGPTIPLLLQAKQNAESWSPSVFTPPDHDFMQRVSRMYASDPILSKTVNPILNGPGATEITMNAETMRRQNFVNLMETTAKLMTKENGARIASIDLDGWDTHAGQGLDKGRLGQALKNLSEGLEIFKQGMGTLWKQTAVLMITEFGRTVLGNGTGGTDHGIGSVAFLAGGNVNGGRVIGDWPGLAKNLLYQERDLYPANDLRCLIKGILKTHLNVTEEIIEQSIFPESTRAVPYSELFR